MRRLLKLVTGRFFWTFVFIFLQIGVVALTLALVQNRFGLAAVNSLLGIVISLLIFARNDVPEYKLSWILLIMVVPIFGCSMYLIFGNKKKGIVQQKRMDRYHELTSEHVIDVFPGSLKPEDVLNPDECRLSRYVSGLSDSRVYSNTTVDYYALGDDCFPEMVKEIEKAERFIFMEYFIYEKGLFWDTILDILKKKVAAGVEVLLMYDDMGSIGTLPLGYWKELRSYGIKAVAFNPVRPRLNPKLNYRDHRKVCIIDGNVAISGGLNIADEYINKKVRIGHWKDNGFIMKGDGVWNYTFMFLQLWSYSAPEYHIEDFSLYMPTVQAQKDGLVQSFGDSPLDEYSVAENAYMSMINSASKYLWLSTPYLILDNAMINAVTLAARSGVDVRIITPAIPDKKSVYAHTRANYRVLLENGVRIFEYEPGFMHSKMFLSDDSLAIVGTTNMDFRSFYLHFESGTIFYGGKTVRAVKDDFLETFGVCREISFREYEARPLGQKLLVFFSKIAAPLL
ncbi:MAG: cardiolipin synthase [Spirochaetales bacterium]|nr:cardiolipin synthase [Spirochaetales bacterium]